MARDLLLLVPPSEAKAPGGRRFTYRGVFDGPLDDARTEIRAALRSALRTPSVDAGKVFQVRGVLLHNALVATTLLCDGNAPLLPAWRRYVGVVWDHLSPASLRTSQRGRILVPSALYGLTTAQDHIAEYRLKMNVQLEPVGGLAAFWRPRLTPLIIEHRPSATIVNLLPREHAGAIDLVEVARHRKIISVPFLSWDGAKQSGHDAKAAKGVLARRIVQEGLGALASFEWNGWSSETRDGVVTIVAPHRSTRARRSNDLHEPGAARPGQ